MTSATSPRERPIVRGLIYVLFGLVLSAVAVLLLGALLIGLLFFAASLVVPGLDARRDPMDYLGALFAASLVSPIGVVLMTYSVKLVRLGVRCMRPEGVGLEEIEPGIHALATGVYVYRSLGSRTNPFVVHTIFFFFNAFGLLCVAIFLMHAKWEEWPALAGFVAMLGVGIGGWTYLGLQGRKFGKSTCRMRSRHPRIGGVLDAEVEVEVPRRTAGPPPLPSGPVSVKLQYITRQGSVAWETVASVPVKAIARPADGTLRIPVRVAIPLEARKLCYGAWRLRLQAPFPAIDYASVFWPVNVMPPDPDKPAQD